MTSAMLGVRKYIVKAIVPKFTIDAMTSPFKDPRPNMPIRRIAWSKDCTLLAALAIWRDTGYITVWDMKNDSSIPKHEDISILERKCAVGTVKHTGLAEFLEDLSIGLAISADGTQVAVYQEPMVGQWNDGSESINSAFPFHLLTLQTVPDPPQPKENAPGHVTVPDPQSKENAPEHVTVPYPLQPEENAPEHVTVPDPQPKENAPEHVTVQIDSTPGCTQSAAMTYEKVDLPHDVLKSFVGFGAFLSGAYEEVEQSHGVLNTLIGYGSSLFGARGSDRDKGNSNVPQTAHAKYDKGGKESNVNAQPSNSSRQSKPSRMLFAACNGIYTDVFKVKLGQKWRHTHSIRLTDLTPTINRRITCQMMMDTIGSNTFMWIEDGGVCCMIWDLRRGSNISYIAGPDNTKFGSAVYRGNSTMSTSPDQSMVALASVDGTLTTFYASTGVAISSKKFTLFQIEYVAFTDQNNQLFVIIRDTITLAFKSLILDPLQLNSGMRANQVPVPIIGRTILAYFRDERFKDKGLVCKTNGSKIQCYTTHEPVANAVAIIKDNIVCSNETHYPSLKNDQKAVAKNEPRADLPAENPVAELAPGSTPKPEQEPMERPMQGPMEGPMQGPMEGPMEGPMLGPEEGPKEDKKYEVRTAAGKERCRDDDDLMFWILRVEVVERDHDGRNEKVIFSFVPEPWVNIPAAGFPRPKELQKVYFLTGRKRFVVVGMQTLQVWSLPTNDNDHFNLVFIWSRPKANGDQERLKAETTANSDPVGGKPGKSKEEEEAEEKEKETEEKETDEKETEEKETEEKETEEKETEEKETEEKDPEKKKALELQRMRDEKGENAANDRKAAEEKETSSRKTIETEIVGDYYHFIQKLDIHLNLDTGDANACIELKGGSGTDVVSIPGDQSGNIDSTFFNCARSIHLLAASYAYSTQENMNFLRALDKSSLTPKEHAEAIARFTRCHINRLLPSQYLNPSPLTDEVHASSKEDTPIHTSPENVPCPPSRPQNTRDNPSTEKERRLTLPVQAPGPATLHRYWTQGSITTQRSYSTSPAQALDLATPLHQDSARGSIATQQSHSTSLAQGPDPAAHYRSSTRSSTTTQQSRPTSPTQASDPATLRRYSTRGSTTTQQSRPTSPTQASDPAILRRYSTRGSTTTHRTHPMSGIASNVSPTCNILVALGGNTSADQKLQGQSHSSPALSVDQKLQEHPHRSPTLSAPAAESQGKKGKASFMKDTQREKLGAQKDEDASADDIFTVLTLLLGQDNLRDTNHVFIEGLFKTDGHEWVPHPSMALNPIERVMNIKNERLLKILIEYCVKNARKFHPGYLTPVIQCLSELSECHSDIVSDLFRKASFIRARNPMYVTSNAIVANLRFSDWTNFKRGLSRIMNWIKRWSRSRFSKSSDTHPNKDQYMYHYEKPVFSLRSQLPFHNHMGIISTVLRLDLSRRKKRFPQGENKDQQPTTMHQSMGIYVSPFQFKPIKGRDGRRGRSFLAEIAGKDFFDSPVMEASLWYTW